MHNHTHHGACVLVGPHHLRQPGGGGGRETFGGWALGVWGDCILRGLDTNLMVLFRGGGGQSPTPHSPKHHTTTHHSPNTHTPTLQNPTHHTSTHHSPPPHTTIPRGGRVALPMKPEAPLSALGHSTACNLPTMNTHTHTHTHTQAYLQPFSLYSMSIARVETEICRNKGNTLSNLKRKGKERREERVRRDVCGRGWVCGGVPTPLFVCVCACVRACFFLFHTRKGALMLYALYVEPTMGHLEAPMKGCTRGWSSQMAS